MSKAEKTKQFIVEKTAPLFNAKGYAGTSLSDMTEATGLTKGSIYGNFCNKDEVALAAFDHNLRTVKSIIAREMDMHTTAMGKLLVYVDVYSNYGKYPFPEGGCPMLNTAIEADDTHPALRKKALDAVIFWKDSLMRIIRGGIERGELRADVDAEQAAVTMIAMIEGAIMLRKLTGKLDYQKTIMLSVEKLVKELR